MLYKYTDQRHGLKFSMKRKIKRQVKQRWDFVVKTQKNCLQFNNSVYIMHVMLTIYVSNRLKHSSKNQCFYSFSMSLEIYEQ